MKRVFIISLLALGSVASSSVQAATPADFNRAVMQVYEDMLRENSKDYETYFRRANAYYSNGDYIRAINDLDSALKYVPAVDTDTRGAIYSLRAQSYAALKRYSQALPDINEALKLSPSSVPLLQLRGKIAYELGDYAVAKEDYNRMLRLYPRSQEAYFGLAMVAAKENNIGMASEYMQKGVALAPDLCSTYLHSAKVRQNIGDYNAAVQDLIMAMAIDPADPQPLPALINMADTNYPAVMAGLTDAIQTAPDKALFYYLRGIIASQHYHYATAIDDFKYILDNNLDNYSGVYCALAECYYHLCDWQTALDNSDAAIAGMQGEHNAAHYYTVRAQILRAMNQTDKALAAINRALDFSADDFDAMEEKALILVDKKEAADASALLGELVMTHPFSPMPYMLRAWVLNDYLNQPSAAKGLYGRVADLDLSYASQPSSFLGFAQLFDGKTADGIAWIDAILAQPDYDGLNHYYGACFYAWAGRTDKALECVEASLKAGYANYYDWLTNADGRINVLPLRDDARFTALIDQYRK